MVGKKIGVDIWLPMQICIFSIRKITVYIANTPADISFYSIVRASLDDRSNFFPTFPILHRFLPGRM